ncbi:MAG: hypothetical protein GWO20_03880 [Candidatus Korarchaeota archaeon]|nr:hypothetical protein [Candidatus Korarchaeota archaeon]NIU82553.1 hypothetical protein [Candidatus Thorarchaeota archaeon]NIW13041.1 hypothetical protein [Candidatus Thorarchaeota archaeon]NIW51216.1 hypothetical protein [Candidatus Korarchaeota archaeon]
MESEFKEQVESSLETPYRFPFPVQIFLLVLLSLVTIGVLYTLSIPEPALMIRTSVFMCVLAIVYPFFIHTRNRITHTVAFALFGGGLASMVALTLRFIQVYWRGALLAVIFLEVMAVELLHHTTKIFRTRKNMGIYALDVVLSAGFFVLVFLFLWNSYGGPLAWFPSVLLAFGLGMLFFYAIIPEQEF